MTHDIVANDRTELVHDTPAWPALPRAAWQDTYETLHMWTQIIGKIRLQQCTPLNHWWPVPLYVTARGLTTSPIPYGAHTYEISFDFLAHVLHVDTSRPRRIARCSEFSKRPTRPPRISATGTERHESDR